LGRHFLANFCRTSGFAEKSLTATAIERLEQEHWPGNVRELRHFIDNLAVFSDGEIIDHLQVMVQIRSVANAATGAPHWKEDRGSYKETTDSFEKDLILKALQESHGNITHAAAKLNIDRATLSKKIKRYGLK
jgi:DNA-binding NtrC family response regulator